MTERISEQPDIPTAVRLVEELQSARPNDWERVVVDIYDEQTIAAIQMYKSLNRLRDRWEEVKFDCPDDPDFEMDLDPNQADFR